MPPRGTLAERLAIARERYPVLVGPLPVLFVLGLGASPWLAWVAGTLAVLLTLNKLMPRLRR